MYGLTFSSIQIINIFSNLFLQPNSPQIHNPITSICLQSATITKPPLSGTSLPTSNPTALNIPSSRPTIPKFVKVSTETSLTVHTTKHLRKESHPRLMDHHLTITKAPQALLTLRSLSHLSLLMITPAEPSPSVLVDIVDLIAVAGVAVADVDPADAAVAGRIHHLAIST